jgi:hypothetical protein
MPQAVNSHKKNNTADAFYHLASTNNGNGPDFLFNPAEFSQQPVPKFADLIFVAADWFTCNALDRAQLVPMRR